MDYQAIKRIIKKKASLSEKGAERFAHTQGVIKMACLLNKHHALNLADDEVKLAALLHDYGKFTCHEKLALLIDDVISKCDKSDYPAAIKQSPKLWHSFVGADQAKRDFPEISEKIIDVIKYHTTGKPQMSTLLKLIYVSDAIEERRDYHDVESFRKLAFTNFEQAIIEIIKDQIQSIEKRGENIHPLTKDTLDYYQKGGSNL